MYTLKELKLAKWIADKWHMFFISKKKNDYYILPQTVRYIIINGNIYDRLYDIDTGLKYIHKI